MYGIEGPDLFYNHLYIFGIADGNQSMVLASSFGTAQSVSMQKLYILYHREPYGKHFEHRTIPVPGLQVFERIQLGVLSTVHIADSLIYLGMGTALGLGVRRQDWKSENWGIGRTSSAGAI